MKRILTMMLALGLMLPGVALGEGTETATLLAINVGKADSLLLRYGDWTYLIDTGAAESWGALSAALRVNGVTRLDGVVLTHTDKDHAGGLMALAQSRIAVDHWYASAYFCEVTEEKHPAVLAAALRDAQVTWIKAGDTLPFGDARLSVIGPTQRFPDKENNNSVVLFAEAAGVTMLLAGDMEGPAEELLLKSGVSLKADVLKVGHHGEGDATTAAFAQAVSPAIAVISTNSVAEPDTPSNKVLKNLKKVGAQVALTENTEGGVLVTAAGGRTEVAMVSWTDLPAVQTGVVIEAKDNNEDTLTLRNTGSEAVDLTDAYLLSERGGEIFVFPEGSVLAPGARATVATLTTAAGGEWVWQEKNVWHNKKDDAAVLCDVYGRELSRME